MKSGLEGRNNYVAQIVDFTTDDGLNEVRPRRPEQSTCMALMFDSWMSQ